MVSAADRSSDFNARFKALLGSKAKTGANFTDQDLANVGRADLTAVQSDIAQGKRVAKGNTRFAKAESATYRLMNAPKTKKPSSKADFKPNSKLETKFKNPDGTTKSQAQRLNILLDEYKKQDKGFLNGLADTSQSIATTVFQKPLEQLAKPAYGLFEGTRAMHEAYGKGDYLGIPKDFAQGVWEGLKGDKKTGFGDIIEQDFKNLYGVPDASKEEWKKISDKEGLNSGVLKWAKRGVGLAGDIALDPLNAVAAGSSTVSKATKGLRGVDAYVDEAARAIDNVFPTTALKDVKVRVPNPGGISGWETAQEVVKKDVIDRVNARITQIEGGALKGKTIAMKPEKEIANVINDSVMGFTKARIDKFEEKVAKFTKGISAKTLKAYRQDPVFETWYQHVTMAGTLKPTAIKPNYLASGKAWALNAINNEANDVMVKLQSELRDKILNVPTLKFFGNEVAEFPKVGELYAKFRANSKVAEISDAFGRAFSYSSSFPGKLSHVDAHYKSLGAHALGELQSEGVQYSSILTDDLQKEITNAINKSYTMGTPEAEAARLWIKDQYKKMFDEEIAAGLRVSPATGASPGDGYTYMWLKGKEDDIKKFRDTRKATVRNSLTNKVMSTAEAKAAGLHPEENAFVNLYLRKAKSNQMLSRAYVTNDITTHYAIRGQNITARQLEARNWVKLKGEDFRFATDWKAKLKPGEELYMDADIHRMMKNLQNISKGVQGSQDVHKLVRAFDSLTKRFKVLNTVYFPGFHVKNFASDMVIGLLDGVHPDDYTTVINKFLFRNKGAEFKIAGKKFSYDELYDMFIKYVDGGYYESEILQAGGSLAKKDNALTRAFKPVENFAKQTIAKNREDLGRFTHFYSAMKDELPAALKRYSNPDVALQKAIEASTARVNFFKFDYGALTNFEQKYMRRGIPFYTYMRKAVPVILQSMYLAPKWLSRAQRIGDSLRKNGGMDDLVPDWLKEIGFAPFTGGEEPWGVTDDILPSATIRGATDNPAATLNPLFQLGIEASTGKELFTGKKLEGDNFIDRMNPFRDPKLYYGKLRAGNIFAKAVNGQVLQPEFLLTFFGLPVRQNTTERQNQAAKALIERLKGIMEKDGGRLEAKGYKPYLSIRKDGISFRVQNEKGEVVGDFETYKDYKDWLKLQD